MIKYNYGPTLRDSNEASEKNNIKIKKGRASTYKYSLDEKAIKDKLVLSPIIVRAKLLKVIKTRKNVSNKHSQVIQISTLKNIKLKV